MTRPVLMSQAFFACMAVIISQAQFHLLQSLPKAIAPLLTNFSSHHESFIIVLCHGHGTVLASKTALRLVPCIDKSSSNQ
jgi:hypothetical protein